MINAAMKNILMIFLLLLLCSIVLNAQLPKPKLAIGFNPLGIVESQLFVGPTASFRFAPKYEVWTEIGAVVRNNYMPKQWTSMQGFRIIVQGRRLAHPNKKSFIAAEFRLKNFSSDDSNDFINYNTLDTLFNMPYRQNQTILGGGIVFGSKNYLNKKHTLFLEKTLGFGVKQRFTKAQNISPGYEFRKFEEYDGGPGLSVNYDDVALPYITFGLRLMWAIGKNKHIL
jgi:hypothetical protein